MVFSSMTFLWIFLPLLLGLYFIAKEKYQVYRKYDTHWNKIGAFIGTIVLQKAIDSKFEYDFNDMKIEELEIQDKNDLANFASLNDKLYENTIKVANFYSGIKYTVNENDQLEEYISNSKNDKTLLMIGDSFREDMREYFSKIYKKVVYTHKNKFKKEMLEKVKPDIVVIESVERSSHTIGKKYF